MTEARGGGNLVFEALRGEIIALRLKPGAVLSRVELQERFHLSSTPVRDALMRLRDEGLVEIFPQHATIVSPIDLTRARQGHFLRRSIELELVRSLALSPPLILVASLRSLIRQQGAFADLGEYEAFGAADQSFHRLMYQACHVEALWHLVQRQSGHIDRLRRLNLPVEGKMRDIISAHGAIVDAVEAGQPEEAQKALRGHLSGSLDFVNKLREDAPDFFRD